MSKTPDDLSSVMVLEAGAQWPQWIVDYQRLAPNALVVPQLAGESISEQVDRVTRRLNGRDGTLRVAIVACSPTVNVDHLASRERLCRSLLRGLDEESGGEVVLAASIDGSDASKHAIFELAGLLCEGLRGSNRVVRVRFSEGHAKSGVMARVTPEDSVPELDRVASGGERA